MKEEEERLYRRPQGRPYSFTLPHPETCQSPPSLREREREKWGRGERDGGGKSKKIAKVNGPELEAASATAV